jgi:translocation and assembly module TamA
MFSRVGLAAAFSLALGACATDSWWDLPERGEQSAEAETPAVEAAAPELPGIPYSVEIMGIPEAALKDLLEQASQLVTLRDRPPATVAALRRRADGDLERLQAALRSEGFYAARLSYEIDEATDPMALRVVVATGPVYLLADYAIRFEGAEPPPASVPLDLESLGLRIGMPARAPTIVGAESALLERLADRGYPLAKILDRKSVVDHDQTTMTVTLSLDGGPQASFGRAEIEGLERVEADYVDRLVAWTEGEPYDRRKIEETRGRLTATGLFDSVRIKIAETVDAEGHIPVGIAVTETKHRSIGFGAGYSTSEGAGGNVFWEHRNLFGRNEQIRLSLTAAEIEQVLEAELRKPAFLRADQSLLARTALNNRTTEAFDEESAEGFIGVERRWGRNWMASLGTSAEYSILSDEQGEATFLLLGLPAKAVRDTADGILNPTRGSRLTFEATPYLGGIEENLAFFKTSVSASAYYAVDADKRFVLAGRTKLGSIAGAGTNTIPANTRFYAGGGGSIRGYGFQTVGPLDSENDPLGGRSLLELGGELRIRITEDIGIVPFFDGGTVYDDPYPGFDETIRWGAGIGFRYFTAIGPIRFDIAMPLNKRDNVDDDYQFYISLGQAF